MTTHRNVFLFIGIFACATLAGILGVSYAHADGSQTYSTPGTYSFTVPSYATLTVQVWGGGGGGGASGNGAGSAGGQSSFNTTVLANGGGGGDSTNATGAGGAGGTASGGSTNTTGTAGNGGSSQGSNGAGGASPNGGSGGAPSSNPGNSPGGGGSGAHGILYAGGGGGGGYSTITYTTGQLTVGASISVVVGAVGAGSGGGNGAAGQVSITYTSPLVRIIRLRGHIRLKGNIRLAGVTPVTPVSPCAGTRFGGYCWYFSPASGSCTTACATHGSCNLAGITAYGSSGNEAMCTALLTAMGAPAPGYAFLDGATTGGNGCMSVDWGTGVQYWRDTDATSCSADNSASDSFLGASTYRACSCTN